MHCFVDFDGGAALTCTTYCDIHPFYASFLEIFFFFLRQTVGKRCCKILRVNVEVKSFFFSHNVAVSIDTRGSEGTGSGMNFI